MYTKLLFGTILLTTLSSLAYSCPLKYETNVKLVAPGMSRITGRKYVNAFCLDNIDEGRKDCKNGNHSTRVGYDYERKTCVSFNFTGCGGNGNSFKNFGSCYRQCGNCMDPMEVGHCYNDVIAYFFNRETGKCQQFSFSGCGGNGNNYGTLKDCTRNCGDVRDLKLLLKG